MIEAKVIKDSISPEGVRITTVELKYFRFVLAELNTHRVFSRNSASSRAIPVKKMISDILSEPATPVFWGANQPGMQASVELTGIKLYLVKKLWRWASYPSIMFAYLMQKLGLHKQIANRLIEPWMYTKTIVTSTEWENFFELRCHPDAQPEIKELADKIRDAIFKSVPTRLVYGEWHLPYITDEEYENNPIQSCIKMSVARCARVSFLTHDGQNPSKEKDFELYNRLVGSDPKHSSPAEHQATPMDDDDQIGYTHTDKYGNIWSGNFRGWSQYRQSL